MKKILSWVLLIILLITLTLAIHSVITTKSEVYYLKEYFVYGRTTYSQIWRDEMQGISWNNAQTYFQKDNGFLPSTIRDGQTIFIRVKE